MCLSWACGTRYRTVSVTRRSPSSYQQLQTIAENESISSLPLGTHSSVEMIMTAPYSIKLLLILTFSVIYCQLFYWPDLCVRNRSRSLEMVLFDRSHSYSSNRLPLYLYWLSYCWNEARYWSKNANFSYRLQFNLHDHLVRTIWISFQKL